MQVSSCLSTNFQKIYMLAELWLLISGAFPGHVNVKMTTIHHINERKDVNLKYAPWSCVGHISTISRNIPFRNLAFCFILFLSECWTMRGTIPSSGSYSKKFHGKVALPGIDEWHKLNIRQGKKQSLLGKLPLTDIKCQQCCSWIRGECGLAASIHKDSLFRTILALIWHAL